MGDVLAHEVEQWLRARERRVRAAHHDCQGRLLRTHFAAGNRRVDIVAAGRVDFLGERLGLDRAYRGHIDNQRPRFQSFGHTAGAEQHIFHVRRIRYYDDDHLRLRRDRFRIGHDLGGGPDFRGQAGAFRHNEVVAAVLQVERHRTPHDAEADKTDFHAVLAESGPVEKPRSRMVPVVPTLAVLPIVPSRGLLRLRRVPRPSKYQRRPGLQMDPPLQDKAASPMRRQNIGGLCT